MQILNLHQWDVGVHRAREIQEELRSRISLVDSAQINELRRVGGADVSYTPKEGVLYGAVVVLSFPDLSWVKRGRPNCRLQGEGYVL